MNIEQSFAPIESIILYVASMLKVLRSHFSMK